MTVDTHGYLQHGSVSKHNIKSFWILSIVLWSLNQVSPVLFLKNCVSEKWLQLLLS